MAIYLRGMQPVRHTFESMSFSVKMCILYESPYMEPDVFIRENLRFRDAALEDYRDRCAGDQQSEENEDSLITQIAVCFCA